MGPFSRWLWHAQLDNGCGRNENTSEGEKEPLQYLGILPDKSESNIWHLECTMARLLIFSCPDRIHVTAQEHVVEAKPHMRTDAMGS